MDGILLVDKPMGITSHDAVDTVRRRFRIRRVGHAGTLDPDATGLLILLLGKATRKASHFLGMEKEYRARLRLGIRTDTQDRSGRILQTLPVEGIAPERIQQVFSRFEGPVEQEIPAFSAVRIQGKRSYELARAGILVPRRSRKVTIHRLKVSSVSLPEVEFEVTCSKGTYIRSLCADIGDALGCGGILIQLRRIRIGPFRIKQALPLEELAPEHILPIEE